MDFPKSFSFITKIRWSIRNLFIGSVKMPKGFFFCMMHKNQPVIHRAAASKDNAEDMLLVGIEIKWKSNHNNPIAFGNDYYENDYESSTFHVYRLKLKPGESAGCHLYYFPSLMIVLKGICRISTEGLDSAVSINTKLACGEFRWHDSKTALNISNVDNEALEAITIALK